MKDVDNEIIPVGCILTMVGTGSEMNGGYKELTYQEIVEILKESMY